MQHRNGRVLIIQFKKCKKYNYTPIKMKAIRLCIFISLLLLACKPEIDDIEPKPDPDVETKELTTTSHIQFRSSKNAVLLLINTKTEWNINSSSNWLTFTAVSGKNNTGILISAAENVSLPRKASISLSSGTENKEITVQQAGAPSIDISVGNQNFRMILVEAGKFTMGDPDFYSFTLHEVQVDSFYISETEVTNGLWREITGSLPYDTVPSYTGASQLSKTNLPVSYVSWHDIDKHFFPQLKTRKAFNFRLPTEAEWEYAAAGGKHSRNYKYAGSNNAYDVAWYTYESFGTTVYGKKEVKTLQGNELGLYDMSGNVSEWCSDWYADYTAEAAKNPKGPNIGTKKAIRGGNYQTSQSFGEILECKVRYRSSAVPNCYEINWPGTIYESKHYRCECVGFRIVLAVDKQ